MLDNAPVWVMVLLLGTAVLVTAEIGYRIGVAGKREPGEPASDELVLAASFTLVALLLGFTFSMGLGRFEARRTAIVREANAVAAASLRADLLVPKDASALRDGLRRYLDERIGALSNEDPAAREASTKRARATELDVWKIAVAASNRDPQSDRIPLLLQSIDDAIGAASEEDAVLAAYVPKSVVALLFAIALLATMLLGFRFGRNRHREVLASVLLAIILSLAIGIVLDLGSPQRGMIHVSLTPLADAKDAIPK